VGSDAPSIEQKIEYLKMLRDMHADGDRSLDHFLLMQILRLREGLSAASDKQSELAAELAKLTASPFHCAMFVGPVVTPAGGQAVVLHGSTQRVVGLHQGVSLNDLTPGDEVFLANHLNLILARSPRGVRTGGETALFDRWLPNGSLAIKSRDDELIVEAAPGLAAQELAAGDVVRFERNVWMAFEKVDRARSHTNIIEDVPDTSPDQIGGLDSEAKTLFSALTLAVANPERAKRYGLGGRQSILMIGPPGNGKTLLARTVASGLKRLSGSKCRFAVVKPAEFESPWVGETQANIRNFFKALREAATDGYVVAFFDEIEAVGRTRGSAAGHHADKFLAAFLAELDGFTDRRNIAIISATNRKDLIDGALLQRISDIEIPIGRPDARGARAIFRIHLPPTLPFSPNGSQAQATREEIVETAVSRFYSPNLDNEISVIRFRDGKERTVLARELVSGRIFEQVCRQACRSACEREECGGEPGVRLSDIDEAATQAIQRMRTTLSVENASSYLTNLPQDISIVSCQPVVRKVQQPARYLNS
jgi:proteasome-associated ATPase